MASTSSGSAFLEILADRQLFETHFGISYAEAPLDSDESDLEMEMCEDWGDENWSTDRFAGKYTNTELLLMIYVNYTQNLHVHRW